MLRVGSGSSKVDMAGRSRVNNSSTGLRADSSSMGHSRVASSNMELSRVANRAMEDSRELMVLRELHRCTARIGSSVVD